MDAGHSSHFDIVNRQTRLHLVFSFVLAKLPSRFLVGTADVWMARRQRALPVSGRLTPDHFWPRSTNMAASAIAYRGARWGFGSAFSANQKSGRTRRSAGAAQFFLQGQSITAAAMKAFDRVLSIFGIVSTWPSEIVSSRTYCRCRPHFAHCNRRTNQKTRKCRPRFAWFAIAVARGSLFESPAGSAETKRRPLGWE